MTKITKKVLDELLIYSEITGKLYWKHRDQHWFKDDRAFKIWNTRFAGKEAFTANSHGYRSGSILGVRYFSHRIIWVMVYGEWPNHIDHINGNPADNRLDNLRSVPQKENRKNCRIPSNNTSGIQGVSWNKLISKWTAQIKVNKVKHHLGCFSNIDEAISCRKQAELLYNFHPNHGRFTEI